jgi:hypothetical protein
VSLIITSQIDPILMIHRISPGTHFRGHGTIELPDLARTWIDGEEKKRGIILSKREVNRIAFSFSPRTDISSPDDGFSHGNAKISLSE